MKIFMVFLTMYYMSWGLGYFCTFWQLAVQCDIFQNAQVMECTLYCLIFKLPKHVEITESQGHVIHCWKDDKNLHDICENKKFL